MRKWNSTGLHLHLQILLVLALSYCKILCLYSLCSLVTQSCPTLCDPMDCRLPGSSFHGILQARVLEWVAISFSRGYSQPRDWTQVSHIVCRFFTSWATGKPKNTGVGSLLQQISGGYLFSRRIPSPALQANSLPTELSGKPDVVKQHQKYIEKIKFFNKYVNVQW